MCNSICVIVALFICDGGSYRINVNCICDSYSVNAGTCFRYTIHCRLRIYLCKYVSVCVCRCTIFCWYCALLNEHVWMVYRKSIHHNYPMHWRKWNAFTIKNLTTPVDDMSDVFVLAFEMYLEMERRWWTPFIYLNWIGMVNYKSNKCIVVDHFWRARIFTESQIDSNCLSNHPNCICFGFELELFQLAWLLQFSFDEMYKLGFFLHYCTADDTHHIHLLVE